MAPRSTSSSSPRALRAQQLCSPFSRGLILSVSQPQGLCVAHNAEQHQHFDKIIGPIIAHLQSAQAEATDAQAAGAGE